MTPVPTNNWADTLQYGSPGPGELKFRSAEHLISAATNELVFLGEGTRGPYVVGGARDQFHRTVNEVTPICCSRNLCLNGDYY
jgi:hypothetical protein